MKIQSSAPKSKALQVTGQYGIFWTFWFVPGNSVPIRGADFFFQSTGYGKLS